MLIRKAVFSVAGVVAALAMGSPAMAGGIYVGNVDVTITDVATGNTVTALNNVSILQAATFCNVDVNVISAVLGDDKNAKCTSKTNNHQQAWIKKH